MAALWNSGIRVIWLYSYNIQMSTISFQIWFDLLMISYRGSGAVKLSTEAPLFVLLFGADYIQSLTFGDDTSVHM